MQYLHCPLLRSTICVNNCREKQLPDMISLQSGLIMEVGRLQAFLSQATTTTTTMPTAVAGESIRDDGAQLQKDSLALDASDPLDMLLNNCADTDDSELSQGATPPDWSQFTSLWPVLQQHHHQPPSGDALSGSVNTKPQDSAAEFDFSFLMDMDFAYPTSMAIAVDPSMLYVHSKDAQLGPEATSTVPIRPQDLMPDSLLSSADESSSCPSSSPGSPSSGLGGSPVVSHVPTNTMGTYSYWSYTRG